MKGKLRSVLKLAPTDAGAVALLPFAVKSARGQTFTGNDCRSCVVLDGESWRREGLARMVELLLRAPFEVDDPLDGWPTRPSADVFGVASANEHMTSYRTDRCVQVRAWIERPPGGAAKHGRISMVPCWSPYLGGELFEFTKLPTQDRFLAEFERLATPRNQSAL